MDGDHVKETKKQVKKVKRSILDVRNVLFTVGIRWFVCTSYATNRILLGNRSYILLYISMFFYILLLLKQIFIQ